MADFNYVPDDKYPHVSNLETKVNEYGLFFETDTMYDVTHLIVGLIKVPPYTRPKLGSINLTNVQKRNDYKEDVVSINSFSIYLKGTDLCKALVAKPRKDIRALFNTFVESFKKMMVIQIEDPKFRDEIQNAGVYTEPWVYLARVPRQTYNLGKIEWHNGTPELWKRIFSARAAELRDDYYNNGIFSAKHKITEKMFIKPFVPSFSSPPTPPLKFYIQKGGKWFMSPYFRKEKNDEIQIVPKTEAAGYKRDMPALLAGVYSFSDSTNGMDLKTLMGLDNQIIMFEYNPRLLCARCGVYFNPLSNGECKFEIEVKDPWNEWLISHQRWITIEESVQFAQAPDVKSAIRILADKTDELSMFHRANLFSEGGTKPPRPTPVKTELYVGVHDSTNDGIVFAYYDYDLGLTKPTQHRELFIPPSSETDLIRYCNEYNRKFLGFEGEDQVPPSPDD